VDNLLLLQLLAAVTYAALNFAAAVAGDVTAQLAIPAYFVLTFCMNGHFRALMLRFRFTRAKLLVYKLNRMYGVLFYLLVGLVSLYLPAPATQPDNYKDLYLVRYVCFEFMCFAPVLRVRFSHFISFLDCLRV
jgi:hypothetical protein